jgi:polyisoprenyl-phosphate glycosyltransferase
MDIKKKLISIIIPVFNEEDNINSLYSALLKFIEKINGKYEFEFVFTDNHSKDKTFNLITELAGKDKRIKAARFSKNFGFQKSIFTGYTLASGDAAIQIDCDLQDPPEVIIEFLSLWEKGYKVVYGIRKNRKEFWLMNLARKIFYRMINVLSEEPLPLDAGDFRLVDRKVLDILKEIDDSTPYLRGTIATLGFNQIGIEYNREERKKGKSKFSFKDLFNLAMDGILNHSVIPLRIATYTGGLISLSAFICMIAYFIMKIFWGNSWPAGFTTIILLLLLSLGLNSLFLGIIGEYIGRIYHQVKKRPITIIEKQINI